jgi:hypothetical protein
VESKGFKAKKFISLTATLYALCPLSPAKCKVEEEVACLRRQCQQLTTAVGDDMLEKREWVLLSVGQQSGRLHVAWLRNIGISP